MNRFTPACKAQSATSHVASISNFLYSAQVFTCARARCTTQSTPCIAPSRASRSSKLPTWQSICARSSSGRPAALRTSTRTPRPAATSCRSSSLPMKPAPPSTRMSALAPAPANLGSVRGATDSAGRFARSAICSHTRTTRAPNCPEIRWSSPSAPPSIAP